MSKRLIILIASLVLVVPFVFFGCSGDDGATGPQGPPGPTGSSGGPGTGIAAQETCSLCHGGFVQITEVHGLDPTTGDKKTAGVATVTIDNVVLPAPVTVDNYVKVRVDFTFQAFDSDNVDITSSIDLTKATAGALTQTTFSIAKLVPGTNGSSNQWNSFVLDPGASGSGPYRTVVAGGTKGAIFTRTSPGTYSYTFADNVLKVSDGYADNVVYRVTVQASNFDVTLFTSDPILQANNRRAAANAFRDQVGFISGAPVTFPVPPEYPTKNDVTTAACNQCHDPLGFHSQSARRETTYCVVCHNVRSETVGRPAGGGFDNINLMNLVHKVHINYFLAKALGWTKSDVQGAQVFGVTLSEITYPQDIRNCTTCHKGTDDFWKTRPTRYTCGSCHAAVNFATGAGHLGGARADDSACAGCHQADTDSVAPSIVASHSDPNTTPGNVPVGLDNIVYFIDNVTVDPVDNVTPVVGFHITKNGAPMTLTTWPPTGYADTGGPTFLVAYTKTQDGITTPADYNNLGKAAAQPASVTLKSLSGSLTGGPSGYTAKLTTAPFPAGAKMRAVALQAYFSQVVGNDNVGRHTPAVQMPVKQAGVTEAVRRAVVDSNKCLECHKKLELHGGSRVNNVQVCVMCHNPNLSSSGRTTPAGKTPVWGFGPLSGDEELGIAATSAIPPLTSDPLIWPERSNNFRELVHGLHASEMRGSANPYKFVRLRSGTAYYFDFSEVLYPGDLTHCTKCHINGKFEGNFPASYLFTTEETTNDNNTTAGITQARTTVPNSTDVVDSPTAAACGFCHDDNKGRSHIVLQGGQIKAKRGTALQAAPPPLMPDVTP